jgi:hypothetical protein
VTRAALPPLRRLLGRLGPYASIAAVSLSMLVGSNAAGQPRPAGSTSAVLSFIDAAAGRVEVVRHWPAAPVDVDVYPFVLYGWSGCPGPGAAMMLITGPGVGPPIDARIATVLRGSASARTPAAAADALVRIAAALVTPGNPLVETLKSALPWISDLGTYERLGYAVFLFIRWDGVRCGIRLVSVPEGYGIPFVD